MFGKNWKTSLGGLGMILTALIDIIHGFTVEGAVIHWETDFAAITGGVALLFAKDGNVTGGTVVQPTTVDAIIEKAQEQKDLGFHGKVPLDPNLPNPKQ